MAVQFTGRASIELDDVGEDDGEGEFDDGGVGNAAATDGGMATDGRAWAADKAHG